MKKISTKTAIFILISIILFIIPFFWLKPGEMDLGGDSNRLFFYNPLSMLKSLAVYSVVPYGVAKLSPNQYFFPYLIFLTLLKSIFISPTILIAIFNGFKLGGSFIFMYLIIKELIKQESKENFGHKGFSASILGALFYTFSSSVIDNMKYALSTHDQVFLNPIIFYLILRYLITRSFKYLWFVLLITFVFSTNFSLQAPPPLFAFYPLAIIFLLLYNFFVLKKPIPWKGVIIGVVFFIGLLAVHLFPALNNTLTHGSYFNTRLFEGVSQENSGLKGFNAILSGGKISEHILLPLESKKLDWSLIIIPTLTMIGLFTKKKKNKTVLLVGVFFLLTLFLVSANITHIGVEFYRKLFYIPGFGMFRGFYGQWQWVFSFFYALTVGLAVASLYSRMKRKYVYTVTIIAIGFIIARSWIVFNGQILNLIHRGTKDTPVVIKIDPDYEQMLEFIKKLPNDGRIFHMPFTDYGYGIVGGANRGVYIGNSMVSTLAGKNDFSGYQDIDPFSESYVKLVKEKNYSLIKQMMSLLQVKYVLYNSDEKVSDKYFTGFLYGYTGTPASGNALIEFVKNISEKKVYEVGHYSLFEVEKKNYLPHFYAASEFLLYDNNPAYDIDYSRALSFFPNKPLNKNQDSRIAFIDRKTCSKIIPSKICSQDEHYEDIQGIQLIYKRINPTKYKVVIRNVTKPFLLVFQNQYSENWKLYSSNFSLNTNKIIDSYFDGSISEIALEDRIIDSNPFETNRFKSLFDDSHVQVNGYANAWYITPQKISEGKDYELIVEMTSQKIFYYSFGITVVTLCIFLLYGIRIFTKRTR